MDYTGRTCLVLGLGRTGLARARMLAGRRRERCAWPTRARRRRCAEALARDAAGGAVRAGEFDAATFAGADLIAISPGVPQAHPAIIAAVARAAPSSSATSSCSPARLPPSADSVARRSPAPTARRRPPRSPARCRAAAGLATSVAGNIGDRRRSTSCRTERRAGPSVWVLELSSFQLETTRALTPAAATVLNITDDHLDRYADLDDYAAAKARIFRDGGVQVLNRDDPRSCGWRCPAGRVDRPSAPACRSREEAWGLVRAPRRPWLARGGALLRAGGRPARWPAATTRQCAGRAGAGVGHRLIRLPPCCRPARFTGLPHRVRARRRARRRRLHRRLQGHHVGATVAALEGSARAGRADRRRRRQGPGLRAARGRRSRALPRGAADRPRRAADRSARSTGAGRASSDAARWTRRSRARWRWRSPATRCCCRRPAPASTCSRTTSSAASASRRCVRARGSGQRSRCVRTDRRPPRTLCAVRRADGR